ncbi:MAG: GNAT family N-acetyltransferase [Ginsengibacter sp.]
MIFETERLYVRHWQQTDLHSLHELYSDTAIMEYIRPVLTIDETRQIFNAQIDQYNIDEYLGRYVIIEKASNSFAGIFLLRTPVDRPGVEIGYAFRKQDWGKGFATEIVKAALKYIFTSTNFFSIYAYTDKRNINSKKVLEKSGLTYLENIIEDGKALEVFFVEKSGCIKPGNVSNKAGVSAH